MLSRRASDDSAPILDRDRLVDPELEPRTVRGMVASTPGKLGFIGVVLIVLTLAAGALTSVAIIAREQRIDTLHTETGPRTHSAQELYSSLSIADAAATAGFLSGRVEPAVVRDRYNQAIGEAATALVSTTNGASASDTQASELPAELSRNLAIYTAIVATADANSRVGNPIGVSYLNESSALMHDTMLPAAEQLYTKHAEAQAETQQHLTQPPRAALALCLVALIALIAAQRYLAKRSHRRVNPGLIAATALMALLAIWLSIAGLVSVNASAHDTESAQTMDTLVRARILAQQARADETLALLRRDTDVQAEQEYDQHVADLSRMLDDLHSQPAPTAAADAAVSDAVAALDGWEGAHEDLRNRLDAGDYVGAVTVAIDGGPQDAPAQFTRLDDALRSGIDSLRADASGYTSRSWSSLSQLDVGGATIGVLAGFAIGAGVWPRLNEYR
ncbi:hypothetical protein M2284_003695 [Rhodococcus sp. LBL1]|nr:hypothetical protein [Rhodococcus sp. LBL1]MDH6685388.1 hypothetical protein [Rhodococcus sp. LBL2]